MMSVYRNGTAADRALRSQRISHLVQNHRRKLVAEKTYDRIRDFEAHLRTLQETPENMEDTLPLGATAEKDRRSTMTTTLDLDCRSDSSDSPRTTHAQKFQIRKSASESMLRGMEESERFHERRPPSPLSYYDYGNISLKPRSALTQVQQRAAFCDSAQSTRRAASSSGFYFPGPDCRQGPYGFSMQDPILMPPRNWEPSRVPGASDQHANNVRPRNCRDAGNDGGQRQSFLSRPTVSEKVRSTRGHDLKLQRVFQTMEHDREESCLEQSRHEDGNFEGRWCHPVRPKPGASGGKAFVQPFSWMEQDLSDMSEGSLLASRIVSGITRALQEQHSTLKRLFWAVNRHGCPGVLELDDFMDGLVRIGILDGNESVAVAVLAEAMSLIDPDFDGRVNYPALTRAIGAGQLLQRQKVQAGARDSFRCRGPAASRHVNYGADLPIEVVKMDKNSKSVYDFNRSRDLFRQQQAALLAQHGERVDII